jgi:glyoxylase-like metal-dependent hydrolase (beta-lactamase superfamily II)
VEPTYPNARYLIQRLELADATYPNERTRNAYFGENFLPLLKLRPDDGIDRVRVLSGDTQITPEVRTWVTPGHTRAHQCVVVESRGETAIFLADAVAWAVSLERLAWVPAFDVEPLVSMETKRSLRDWAWRRDALLLFQHDPAWQGRSPQRRGMAVELVLLGSSSARDGNGEREDCPTVGCGARLNEAILPEFYCRCGCLTDAGTLEII